LDLGYLLVVLASFLGFSNRVFVIIIRFDWFLVGFSRSVLVKLLDPLRKERVFSGFTEFQLVPGDVNEYLSELSFSWTSSAS